MLQADIEAIKRKLNAIDWYTQLGSLSAKDGWRVFRDKSETLEHKFIPEKILSMKRKKPLWMAHRGKWGNFGRFLNFVCSIYSCLVNYIMQVLHIGARYRVFVCYMIFV